MTTPGPSSPPRPRVLLVDDEAELRASMRPVLEAEFEVEEAGSAEEAELMMATASYDAIVCDHLMPGKAGLDFLTELRDRRPGISRIMMTGYTNPELISRSVFLAGLSACLVKPLHGKDLAAVIRASLKT